MAFFVVAVVIGVWVAGNPEVQSTIGTPSDIEQLVNHDFASYYSENPAGSFALQVWVNNSWVAAQCIGFAVLLGIPIPYCCSRTPPTSACSAGLMFDAGKGDIFLGCSLPHGLLELTAVFLAGAAGMRLGWSVISPGDRPRGQVLAEQGRAVVAVAVGLVAVLLVSGLIEALVTPSPLPTFVRIGIGVVAEIAFLAYVVHFGRQAPPGPGRPATSPTPRTSSRRAEAPTAESEPPGGLHRQIAVGQRGSHLLGRGVDDVDAEPPQPRRDRAAGRCGHARPPPRRTPGRRRRGPAASRSTRGSATAASIT